MAIASRRCEWRRPCPPLRKKGSTGSRSCSQSHCATGGGNGSRRFRPVGGAGRRGKQHRRNPHPKKRVIPRRGKRPSPAATTWQVSISEEIRQTDSFRRGYWTLRRSSDLSDEPPQNALAT